MARSVRKFKETMELRSALLNRLRSHRLLPVGLLSLALIVVGCLYVWQRVIVIELARDVAALRAENKVLVDKVKKAQGDITRLTMSSRIEQYARDSLHLSPVRVDHLYTLVKPAERDISGDELAVMFSSIKRVMKYLPVTTEARAGERELYPVRFDSDGDTR